MREVKSGKHVALTQPLMLCSRRHAGLYALGKESLLLELAMEFKTWIEVSVDRMETLKALELPDVFTTDPGAGRIRVVEQSEIRAAAFHQWNKEEPTLAILPTSRPLVSFHPNIYVVPYSDHSSYQELEDFVSALQPTDVVPIVGNHIPGSLSALLPSKRRPAVLVPESVQHYMLRESASSTPTNQVQVRHFQPLVPRGVVFESPGKESLGLSEEASGTTPMELDMSEEGMDAGSSEAGSSCLLIDLSLDLDPETPKRPDGDLWNLESVETNPEGVSVESVPLSEPSQSSCVPAQVVTSTDAGSTPARKHFQTGPNQTLKDTAVYNTSQQSQHDSALKDPSLSACDRTSQPSGNGIDREDDRSQHDGRRRNNRAQRGADHLSCSSARSRRVLRQEYVEKIESLILKDLPFSEEDLNPRCLLPQRSVQRTPPQSWL